MNTHDVLAFAIAQETVRRVGIASPPWASLFSATSYITSSRSWPVPDFVIVDSTNKVTIGAEFKPPQQSKREYLTGLGQALAYTRDFDYGMLILPEIADDGYRIARHVQRVLDEPPYAHAPLGLLTYDPATLSPASAGFDKSRFFPRRIDAPAEPATLDQSFYAKWRELSPQEIFLLLSHSYDEMRSPSSASGTVRDRAFGRLWADIQAGRVQHWARKTRNYSDTPGNKIAVAKNYRNFLFHIGWAESDGSITREGLAALHIGTLYGAWSQPFLDAIASAVLMDGKHLILFNAILSFQDTLRSVPTEKVWLAALEDYLEDKGLLKRNPARHAAAVAHSSRDFLKAEKQLWKNLGLIIPRGSRVFHPARGFIFNWPRITTLVQRSAQMA